MSPFDPLSKRKIMTSMDMEIMEPFIKKRKAKSDDSMLNLKMMNNES